ncbi:MAG: class I SAM-dependent methyltransferase [Propionibacteriaceae bacterium]
MDERELHNRSVWEGVSRKHVDEDDWLVAAARVADTLTAAERRLLAAVLATRPVVVHLQSGHGLDDLDLVRAGARSVVGVDYSSVAVGAAQRRANVLDLRSRYVVGEAVRTPLRTGAADLVYTGKGALIWITDLAAWAAEIRRILRPGGTLFVYEAHPAVPLWT